MKKEIDLQFYEVSEEYINYLKRFDDKVPNIKYETREKFVCGVLFNVDHNKYYAPVSSFNLPQKSNFLIKIGEYPIGSIRFSFMFPVPDSEVKIKDFSKEDAKYVRLVNDELSFCLLHKDAITKKAHEVYKLTNAGIPLYTQNCCNFKLLESKCHAWEIMKTNTLENRIKVAKAAHQGIPGQKDITKGKDR